MVPRSWGPPPPIDQMVEKFQFAGAAVKVDWAWNSARVSPRELITTPGLAARLFTPIVPLPLQKLSCTLAWDPSLAPTSLPTDCWLLSPVTDPVA